VQLLADLELRLGLGLEEPPAAIRTAKWADRMAQRAPFGRFYTRSFDIDPLGTARAVLKLRDLLVGATWNGRSIPDGGPRLEALAELEATAAPPLPPGVSDRVVAVARALGDCRTRFYERLALAESATLWDASWQQVFTALERLGTQVTQDCVTLPGAPRESDLGQVQLALDVDVSPAPIAFRGDGSFVLVTAATAWDAARATAGLLAVAQGEQSVVIREHDASALDHALSTQGLRTQGLSSRSPWRAALQVLPLALELMFEPKDPYRVLELLTLSGGPFHGISGRKLARALAESPGIGSPDWEKVKTELSGLGDGPELLERVEEWLETRGIAPTTAAPKGEALRVMARVRSWMLFRIASTPDDSTLLAAAQQAAALRQAVEADPREFFTLIEVRRLAESILGAGTTARLQAERAGRMDHVPSAGCLRVPREIVLWWAFADTPYPQRDLPWRRRELAALAESGIHFPDPRARLSARAYGWRRAILAATRRVILVAPGTSAGKNLLPHPMWDEIVARTGANDAALSRITRSAAELLTQSSAPRLMEAPALESARAVPLPGGHAEWTIGEGITPIERFSATSLNALLSCPLQWVLRYRAGLRDRGHALPPLFRLSGQLGHRLVELLHAQRAFESDDATLEQRAEQELDALFQREGAILLRTGMGIERSQLRKQLVHAVVALANTLRTCDLSLIDVEKPVQVPWRGATLEGSIDLVAMTSNGTPIIIDMKWGVSSYRELLTSGQALQLAAYAFAHKTERGDRDLPQAAYFSLKQGRLLALRSQIWPEADSHDGPSLEETWRAVERSLPLVENSLQRGKLPVAGVKRALPLLSALGLDQEAQRGHFALGADKACQYCDFDVLCGRRWEARP
jgi:hypothetical protein